MRIINYEKTSFTNLCNIYGICGKNPIVAALQELLIYGLKGLSIYARKLRELGIVIDEIDSFTSEALFSTVSNLNFDPEKHRQFLLRLAELKRKAYDIYLDACIEKNIIPVDFEGPTLWEPEDSLNGLVRQGEQVRIQRSKDILDPDIIALQELVTYGLKGISAYLDIGHSLELTNRKKDEIIEFMHEVLEFLSFREPSIEDLMEYALSCGEVNLKAMEVLNDAYLELYGSPEAVKVNTGKVKGKAILVSGHDLKVLEELLKQTEGKNINVFTHGEMLCAHSYPELRKYKHLVGHYGESWQELEKDFINFPGPILLTSNCILEPTEVKRGMIFTTGPVDWGGLKTVENFDFKDLISIAHKSEGFKETEDGKYIKIGFSHKSALILTDKIIELVDNKKVNYVFLIGGCNSTDAEMRYYNEFAQMIPDNCMILTLGCGRFRLESQKYGEIDGLPRVIDIGQCNDAYSVVRIATDIAKAFDINVTHIPFSMILSWHEQKAIAILLSLLYLGVENIRLGPNLPVFVNPNIYKVLRERFNVGSIYMLEDDLKKIAV